MSVELTAAWWPQAFPQAWKTSGRSFDRLLFWYGSPGAEWERSAYGRRLRNRDRAAARRKHQRETRQRVQAYLAQQAELFRNSLSGPGSLGDQYFDAWWFMVLADVPHIHTPDFFRFDRRSR